MGAPAFTTAATVVGEEGGGDGGGKWDPTPTAKKYSLAREVGAGVVTMVYGQRCERSNRRLAPAVRFVAFAPACNFTVIFAPLSAGRRHFVNGPGVPKQRGNLFLRG
ncbi:hypothetical protein MRX96_042486 [Rhipicephalus microplus]